MNNHSDTSHLVLFDGLNIVRPIFEMNPDDDSPQKAQKTIKNALSSFRRAFDELRPTHALAVFDCQGPNWRHALWPQYRAGRKPMSHELRDALPTLYDLLGVQLSLKCIVVPGVEADDVLNTVARRWDQHRGPVTVVSNDKDLASLLASGVRIRDHFGKVYRDEKWLLDKFGVTSALLLDLLALTGDSVDGVPGVPKVGTKTAAKWLNAYGGLDALLLKADELSGVAGQNLRANADTVRLARRLVAMRDDLPLGMKWSDLRLASNA